MKFPTRPVGRTARRQYKRRAVMIVLIAVALLFVIAFVALTIDLGYLTLTRTQLQNAADSAALGSAMNLIQGFGPGATMNQTTVTSYAQNVAVTVSAANRAGDMSSVFCNGTRAVQLGQYQWHGTGW